MSSALPCGTPSTMSNSTTSPSSLRPARWARVPPIWPAPMSAILLRAMSDPSPLRVDVQERPRAMPGPARPLARGRIRRPEICAAVWPKSTAASTRCAGRRVGDPLGRTPETRSTGMEKRQRREGFRCSAPWSRTRRQARMTDPRGCHFAASPGVSAVVGHRKRERPGRKVRAFDNRESSGRPVRGCPERRTRWIAWMTAPNRASIRSRGTSASCWIASGCVKR